MKCRTTPSISGLTLATLLTAALAVIAGSAGPAPALVGVSTASTGSTTSTAASLADPRPSARRAFQPALEDRVVTITNKRRAKKGCRPLRVNADLQQAARSHSSAMASTGTLAHQLPGGPSLTQRVDGAGYRGWRRLAENVAGGFITPGSVVRAWMKSPGHRRNILDCRLREIGVGVVDTGTRAWWTQDFGRR